MTITAGYFTYEQKLRMHIQGMLVSTKEKVRLMFLVYVLNEKETRNNYFWNDERVRREETCIRENK